MAKVFSAYIDNLGAYVAGNSRGGWADFPMPPERLAEIRAEIGGEEQIVLDYDIPEKYAFLHDVVSEYSNPEELNLTGAVLQRMDGQKLEAVEAYAASQSSLTLPELMNVMVQADGIPYYPYQFTGMENTEDVSAEKAYGYTVVENSMQELQDMLGKHGMEGYLDYEAIGHDAVMNGHVDLYENGYMDLTADGPDLNLHTVDELKAEYGMAGEAAQARQEEARDMDRQEQIRGPKR